MPEQITHGQYKKRFCIRQETYGKFCRVRVLRCQSSGKPEVKDVEVAVKYLKEVYV